MIIAIEGSDLTGKSTLIKELDSRLKNSVIIDYPKFPVDLKTDSQLGVILNYTDKVVYHVLNKIKDKIFLCDRFILSELIYSEYLNRVPGETIEDLKNKDLYIFILHARPQALTERFKKRGDKFFELKQIIKINRFFSNFYFSNKGINLNNIWLLENSTFSQMKENLRIILNKIKEIKNE